MPSFISCSGRNFPIAATRRATLETIRSPAVAWRMFKMLCCFAMLAAYVGSWLPTFRDSVSAPYSRFKQSKKYSWTVWPLKVGLRDCPETSVYKLQPTQRNIAEEKRAQLHRGVSLKPR
jgi:hypothetical protein